MSKVELVAVKPFSYMTRRLKAGDRFDARSSEANILVKLGKAEAPRIPGNVPAPPAALRNRLSQLDHDGNGKPGGATGATDHMRELRAEYQRVVGKRPFSGWDEATLREKMAAASQ